MYPRCVVFGIGNESRGDDAVGPLLLERLRFALERSPVYSSFTFISDFQLQIEHTLDLENQDIALFIDAGVPPALLNSEPFSLKVIAPSTQPSGMTHALLPTELMGIASDYFLKLEKSSKDLKSSYTKDASTNIRALPTPYVLCVRGYQFELGTTLSPECKVNSDLAFEALMLWIKNNADTPLGDLACTN